MTKCIGPIYMCILLMANASARISGYFLTRVPERVLQRVPGYQNSKIKLARPGHHENCLNTLS